MKRPSIGELSARVSIKRWADTANEDDSGATTAYDLVATVWGKVEPVGGAVYVGSQQVGNTITHRIFIRYRDGITSANVLDVAGCRYLVRRVTDLDGRFTVIECEEEGAI